MIPAGLKESLINLLGSASVLLNEQDRSLYEYDGGVDKARPDVVVFPRNAEEVSAVVKLANEHGVSMVGRGAGTGLSGGAIPRKGGVMIAFARMNRITRARPGQ